MTSPMAVLGELQVESAKQDSDRCHVVLHAAAAEASSLCMRSQAVRDEAKKLTVLDDIGKRSEGEKSEKPAASTKAFAPEIFKKTAPRRRAIADAFLRIATCHQKRGKEVQEERGSVTIPSVQRALARCQSQETTLSCIAEKASEYFEVLHRERVGEKYDQACFEGFGLCVQRLCITLCLAAAYC